MALFESFFWLSFDFDDMKYRAAPTFVKEHIRGRHIKISYWNLLRLWIFTWNHHFFPRHYFLKTNAIIMLSTYSKKIDECQWIVRNTGVLKISCLHILTSFPLCFGLTFWATSSYLKKKLFHISGSIGLH